MAETPYLPYGEERWTNEAQPTDFTFTDQRAEARLCESTGVESVQLCAEQPLKYADPTGHCWDPLTGSADKCIAAWQRTIDAYEAGEKSVGVLALHASGITDRLVETSEKIDQLSADAETAV